MPENIIQFDQSHVRDQARPPWSPRRSTQILNAMLDAEADEIADAARYERSGGRKAYRAGHYERKLTAKAGRLESEGAQTQGRPVRVRGDRTLPAARAERRGIPDRHVPGGREHPPGRRHQPIAVGRPHALADIERQAQEGSTRRSTSGARGRWNPNTRTCSWTACGTSAPGAGTWRT